MRLTPELSKVANFRRQYERSGPIPINPKLSITLRDRVSNKVLHPKVRPCVPELTVLLQCFKDSDFNEVRCADATKAFYSCIKQFNDAKSQVTDARKAPTFQDMSNMSPQEVNKILKKNPQI